MTRAAHDDRLALVTQGLVGQVTCRLLTTGTQATIPVIPEQSLGSANNGLWDLEAYGPMTSVNELNAMTVSLMVPALVALEPA